MSTASKIEWTETTWNPTTGCDRISPGCDNCYALTLAKRLKAMGSAKYQNDGDPRTSGPGFGVTFHEDALTEPLRWRTPRKVFVNSMSDLFHKDVPDEFIARVWAVMATTPKHTYQILTKRHGRLRSLVSSDKFRQSVQRRIPHVGNDPYINRYFKEWPLPNVWIGVSVEDQKRAELRIPALLDTPAAVRFLSCEPLLGPVDLSAWLSGIGWTIVGGESGPGARPMHPEWARSLRDQCRTAGVAFHFKQWGEHAPRCTLALCGHPCSCNGTNASHPVEVRRVGKKAAGRELDGRTWDEFPAVTG
jgi:protein gp37